MQKKMVVTIQFSGLNEKQTKTVLEVLSNATKIAPTYLVKMIAGHKDIALQYPSKAVSQCLLGVAIYQIQ